MGKNLGLDIADVSDDFDDLVGRLPLDADGKYIMAKVKIVLDYANSCQENNDELRALRKELENILLSIPDDPSIWVE